MCSVCLFDYTNNIPNNKDYISYAYDANGNLTYFENGDYTTIVNMYHDAYNQLITVDDFWNSATQYRYNASGSRYMRRTGSQAAVYTLRDGSVSVGEYSGSVSTTNWNILLPSGEIVGRKPYNNSAIYYLKDHLGSTRATISSTGGVLESVDYYPFGLEMPGRVTLSGQATLQRFTGYERVDGERFDYAQARWYDPVIGRFLSVDPLAEHDLQRDKSPYAYSWNNPIRYNDPTGLCPVCGGSFERYVGGFFNYSVNRTQQNAQTAVANKQADAVTMVKEGPGALDYVTRGAAVATVALGTITYTTGNPVTAGLTGFAAATAVVSEGTATALSGIDAAFLGGDVAEFQSRFKLFTVGLITGQSVKFGVNRALLKQGRDQVSREGATEAAGTTGAVIIQKIIEEDNDERNQ